MTFEFIPMINAVKLNPSFDYIQHFMVIRMNKQRAEYVRMTIPL